MTYKEEDLARIASRENNAKRGYLVVNPLQGKHVPVSPTKALKLFQSLADALKGKYGDERLLLAGFAETATAIGASVAIELGTNYIQTTREEIPGASYLFFSEEHSHATEQKLVKEDLDEGIKMTDRIVFIEDEVTTGNTILNIVTILKKEYGPDLKFAAASLLNGMTEQARKKFEEQGIDLFWLVKTDHGSYESIAKAVVKDGERFCMRHNPNCDNPDRNDSDFDVPVLEISGYMNARRLVSAGQYQKACGDLAEALVKKINPAVGTRILVAGTEEFMYPALFAGRSLEERGCEVRCHATTRSPIAVSMAEDYPLHRRYELRSVYDPDRTTYLYDIEPYDKVIVMTDAGLSDKAGLLSLVRALGSKNNDISIVRWR